MRRRIGRPGLVGTMARTAVIAGTANAVVGGMNRAQQGRAMQAQQQQSAEEAAFESQAQLAEMQAQMGAMQSQAPPPADDLTAKLKQLAELHSSGILSDDEFAAAKAKLLA